MGSNQITVLIADDHPIFRKGLRQVIDDEPSIKVVAEAEDGEEAYKLLRELQPNVAVLDIDMPSMDGFELARLVRQEKLPSAVVFLTMHKDEDVFNEALDLGVKAYVVKDSAATDIVGSIKAAAAGRHYLSPSISGFLLQRRSEIDLFVKERPSLNDLTPTERKVLRAIADNKSSREIASEMFISFRTVENHRANICSKLDLHGSNALLKFALEHKRYFMIEE